MLSEKAQRILAEGIEEITPLVEKMRDAAKSGGPNQMAFIQSRCDAIKKALEEIQEKI